MSKWAKLALVFVFGALFVGFGLWELRSVGPAYGGKSLADWLVEYNQAGAMDKTGPVSDAVNAMGEKAVPYLITCLKHEDSTLERKLLLFARRCNVHLFPPPRNEPALLAPTLLAFKALGPTAGSAIPELDRIFEVPKTRRVGGLALFSIGAASIPVFERACGNTDAAIRRDAASFLALLPASYNSDQTYYCVWYRFDQWSKPQAYVAMPPSPDLIINLAGLARNHSNPNVRQASVEALVSYSGLAQKDEHAILVQALKRASHDPIAAVSNRATAALEALAIVGTNSLSKTN